MRIANLGWKQIFQPPTDGRVYINLLEGMYSDSYVCNLYDMGRLLADLDRFSMNLIDKQTQLCWPRHHAASDATILLGPDVFKSTIVAIET
jgi:hypothetical protein